ncbi:MAG: calcium-binding protein [Aeromicrobium sp.]
MPAWLPLGIVLALLSVLFTPLAAHAGAHSTGGYACTIIGTNGKDVLRGTARRDVICGRGGNDVIKGGKGNDVLDGGRGKDRIYGGPGKDRVFGGAGNDLLVGNNDADRLDGGSGVDRISGGSANDIVWGGVGDDTIAGGAGADQIVGGAGRDDIFGDAGNDTLKGSQGADRLDGGSGADRVSGDSGADRLDGGSGADRVSGDSGDDAVTGASGDDVVAGGVGNDVVRGVGGDDNLSGGAGNDDVDGGAGFNLCDIPGAGDHQLRCATDESAPAVVGLSLSPSTVDVSAADKVIQVNVRVTDDTGVKSVQIGPSEASLVSGTARDGVWRAGIRIARFSTPGPRALDLNARDRVGRWSSETRENVFTVVNSRVDREMPVLTSMRLSTTWVDARAAARPVTATITVTDDLAGPKDLTLCPTYAKVPGHWFEGYGTCVAMRRVSGGPRSSTWTATATVPKGAVGGTWNMEVRINDAADNRPDDSWFGPDAWTALGSVDEPRYKQIPGGAGAFTVVGRAVNMHPPELTSVTLTPSTVDTSRGAVRITATMSGTDDEGITSANLSVSGPPAGATPGTFPWVDVGYVSDFHLVRGTAKNGTWQGTFVVPGGTPDGAYWIQASFADRDNTTAWASPRSGWGTDGTLDNTPMPSTTELVVANSPLR